MKNETNQTKALTLDDIQWTIEALPEDTSIEGNVMASGDDAADKEAEESVRADLESGNGWAWCTVRVTGRWEGLKATDYLGGCSYKSEQDFCARGYYDDMRNTVLAELQEHAENIASKIVS